MGTLDSKHLPDRPEFIDQQTNQPTQLLKELIGRWITDIKAIFDPKTNEHATMPRNAEGVLRSFANRPELMRELALELATIVTEIEKNKGKFGKKKMYPHQIGQLKWLVTQLLEGGSTYLIEGAPATGKTLVLGAVMKAATRLQKRGIFDQSVVFATHKQYTLAQQSFSASQRRERITDPESLTPQALRIEHEFLCQFLEPAEAALFKNPTWNKVRARTFRDPGKAGQHLSKFFASQGMQQVLTRHPEFFSNAVLLAANRATVVYDIDEKLMLLKLSPGKIQTEEGSAYYQGDLGQGIPDDYVDDGVVVARKGADIHGNRVDSAEPAALEKAKVILTTAPSILIPHLRGSIRSALKNAGIFIIDEARTALELFDQAAFDEGNDKKIVVIGASALSTTNGVAARPHANAYSPRRTLEEAMDTVNAEPQVLPNIGIGVFPGPGKEIYPSESVEALQQFINAHFAHEPLMDNVKQKQPYLSNALVVTSPDAMYATVKKLREEYDARGIEADIVAFRANKGRRKGEGNTTVPFCDRILQWMVDKPDPKKPRVKIIVAAPINVKDAISLPNLELVTLATGKAVGRETLLRLFGRAMHNNIHRERGPGYRVNFRFGIYKESDPRQMIFNVLKHSFDMKGEQTFPWTNLQILHGKKGAEQDLKRVKGLPRPKVPISIEAFKMRKQGTGTDLEDFEYEHPDIDLPPEPAPDAMPTIQRFASRITPKWHECGAPQAFRDLVLLTIKPTLPRFMRLSWDAWSRELRIVMRTDVGSPEEMLAAMFGRIRKAEKLGGAIDRYPDTPVAREYVPLEEVQEGDPTQVYEEPTEEPLAEESLDDETIDPARVNGRAKSFEAAVLAAFDLDD